MIGRAPMAIIGFGIKWLSSVMRVPKPPAKITAFIAIHLTFEGWTGWIFAAVSVNKQILSMDEGQQNCLPDQYLDQARRSAEQAYYPARHAPRARRSLGDAGGGDRRFQMKVSDHHRTAGELARFVLVGLLNTGFGYCVYAAGILAGLAPEVALLATFTVALLFNYMTTGRIVFRNAGAGHFPRFAFAYVVIYGINVIVLRAVLGAGRRSPCGAGCRAPARGALYLPDNEAVCVPEPTQCARPLAS
jgi:putative flippase GtrA